ncbi:unnamed protein product [Closterium sp. NIES-64]|nr:unnamed protein product [Closterium sp. NIES-64]
MLDATSVDLGLDSLNAPAAATARVQPPNPFSVFKCFFLMGFYNFGGTKGHVEMMRKEFVDRRGWLDDSQFTEVYRYANAIPGPTGMQMVATLGTLWLGTYLGGILMLFFYMLPGCLSVYFVARFVEGVGQNDFFSFNTQWFTEFGPQIPSDEKASTFSQAVVGAVAAAPAYALLYSFAHVQNLASTTHRAVIAISTSIFVLPSTHSLVFPPLPLCPFCTPFILLPSLPFPPPSCFLPPSFSARHHHGQGVNRPLSPASPNPPLSPASPNPPLSPASPNPPLSPTVPSPSLLSQLASTTDRALIAIVAAIFFLPSTHSLVFLPCPLLTTTSSRPPPSPPQVATTTDRALIAIVASICFVLAPHRLSHLLVPLALLLAALFRYLAPFDRLFSPPPSSSSSSSSHSAHSYFPWSAARPSQPPSSSASSFSSSFSSSSSAASGVPLTSQVTDIFFRPLLSRRNTAANTQLSGSSTSAERAPLTGRGGGGRGGNGLAGVAGAGSPAFNEGDEGDEEESKKLLGKGLAVGGVAGGLGEGGGAGIASGDLLVVLRAKVHSLPWSAVLLFGWVVTNLAFLYCRTHDGRDLGCE